MSAATASERARGVFSCKDIFILTPVITHGLIMEVEITALFFFWLKGDMGVLKPGPLCLHISVCK